MKKLISLFGLAVLALTAQTTYAETNPVVIDAHQLSVTFATVNPYDLINWKVGDEAHFDVSVGPFGKMGKMDKSVTKDEGSAIWVRQYMDLQFQKDTSEMLISKADGKVLKFIHNGKEEAMPDDKFEMISQDATEVTVPAGTFDAIHVVGKTSKMPKLEVWVNPRDTVMEGTIKMVANTGQFDVMLELTNFKRIP